MGTIKENYQIMFTTDPDVVTINQLKEMLGIGAVSYTHLDVYKRQPLPSNAPIKLTSLNPNINLFNKKSSKLYFPLTGFIIYALQPSSFVPVSYTHLWQKNWQYKTKNIFFTNILKLNKYFTYTNKNK